MGACNSVKKPKGATAIHKDEFVQIKSDFQKRLKSNSFYSLSIMQQNGLESDLLNSNKTPSDFVYSNNKFTDNDKQLFSFCYSKCIPFLNNINEKNNKLTDNIFLSIAMFMLTIGSEEDKKKQIANEILKQSMDGKSIDLDKLMNILNDILNVTFQIMIYMVLIFIYMSENEQASLSDYDFRVEGKYPLVDLDKYFFTKLKSINKEKEMENYVNLWKEFIMQPFGMEEKRNVVITDSLKNVLIKRICHLFNADNFLFSLLRFGINYNEKSEK
jgi:hypothetical protein